MFYQAPFNSPLTQGLMLFLSWSNAALPLASVGHVPSRGRRVAAPVGWDSAAMLL